MLQMVRCPQCGADLPLPERESNARCRSCGTAFVPSAAEADHSLVPWALSPLALRQAIKDHWLRSGRVPTAAEVESADVRRYFLPFRRTAAGAVRPAFTSHRAELLAFVPPGADLKRFTAESVGGETILIEPSGEAAAGESLLHYPFARAVASISGQERVVWIDAARGRVLTPEEGSILPGGTPPATAALARAFAIYFAIGIAFRFPWSLPVIAAATPFLLRWAERRVVGAA
jgi:hypothetical protein